MTHLNPVMIRSAALAAAIAVSGLKTIAAPSPGFYTNVPSHLERYKPGDLIKSEPEMDLAPALRGTVAYRIMYRSIGALREAVAETGMVFVPNGLPPSAGWPVVVWGHGTSGVGDACAPSKDPYMFDGGSWTGYADMIKNLVDEGYIVTAPDYEGLGVPGLHTYLNTDSEARAMIDAVTAARILIPQTGVRWIAVGHSEGGQAAVGAGELAAEENGFAYLGAVAFAPATHITIDGLQALAGLKGWAPYLGYMAVGIRATHPGFDYSRFVGPDFLTLMPLAEQDCWDQWFIRDTMRVNPTPATALSPNWQQDPAVLDFMAASDVGSRPGLGPVLYLQGTADALYSGYQLFIQNLCAHGTPVHAITYNNVSHDRVLTTGWADARTWLADRFAGRPAPNDCH
jgi:acetyl esterase/lipase